MVYTFTQEQLDRLEKCRLEFNRLTRSRQSLQQFIATNIGQTIDDCETAAAAVRMALPAARKAAAHGLH